MKLVYLVRVCRGDDAAPYVVRAHLSEELAKKYADELNATEQSRTPGSPWVFDVQCQPLYD